MAFWILAAAAAASVPAGDYEVRVTISDGDKKMAPALLVKQGEAATFMSNKDGLWFKVTARPESDAKVAVTSDVVVRTDEGLQHYGASTDVRADGKATTLVSAPAAGRTQKLSFEVSVIPVPR